jgi:hypothetical protein
MWLLPSDSASKTDRRRNVAGLLGALMNKPALGLLAETRVGSALAPVQDYLVA